MPDELDVAELADALLGGVGVLVRRVRQLSAEGELTMPERSVLSRLDRGGAATSAELARDAQISAQSMGATVAGLAARGLVERRPDPGDGRRVVLSVTNDGLTLLRPKRDTRSQQLARTLAGEFTRAELKHLMVAAPLIERLGHSI